MTSKPNVASVPARVLAVIPARLASRRLPGKMLRLLAGKPLLAWTYEAAIACPQFDQVVVAADSDEIAALCHQHNWPYRMTSPDLPSGTDRLHAIAQEIDADLYVNVQGDEPLISPAHIHALLSPFHGPDVEVSTLKLPCAPEDVNNPNVVKLVTALDGRALYFSRAAIPFDRDRSGGVRYWRHMGLYAYRRCALHQFASRPPGLLEQIEKLEQLRLLETGIPIHVAEAHEATIGVDTEDDLRRVEAILCRGREGR